MASPSPAHRAHAHDPSPGGRGGGHPSTARPTADHPDADRLSSSRPDAAGPAGTRHSADQSSAGLKALYRIPEAMRLLSLSRSVIYEQIRSGRLRSVKEGSARLIPADAITEYVALLETEAEADQ